MKPESMLTQEQLKALVHYNPETGVFTRKVSAGNAKAGRISSDYKGKSFYPAISFNKKRYFLHKLAWLYVHGEYPDFVDHINHDKSDIRIINLRKVSHKENCKNQKLRNTNKSGLMGVRWHEKGKIWLTYIKGNEKVEHLGSFLGKFEACCARKSAENRYKYHENHGLASINEAVTLAALSAIYE